MDTQKISNYGGYIYKLFFDDCIWEDNKICYPASIYNALCETNIETGETSIIGKADENKDLTLFFGIYKYKNYFILPGRNARTALSLFEVKSGEWSYISMDESKKDWLNFREEDVFEYGGYLYIFPFSPVILKVDIEKQNVTYLFYPNILLDKDIIRGENNVRIKNIIYIPMKHNNEIYTFDLSSEQWQVLEVNTELGGIDTLCFDGKLFWMTGIGRMICSWDEKSNTSNSYRDFPQGFCKLGDINKCAIRKGENGGWFCKNFIYGKSIYFIPYDANMLIEFDTEKKEIKEFVIDGEEESEETLKRVGRHSTIKYAVAKKKGNILMLLSYKNKNLIFINLDTRQVNKVELMLQEEKSLDSWFLNIHIIHEGLVDLKCWIKYLQSQNSYNLKDTSQKKIVGENIYFKTRD